MVRPSCAVKTVFIIGPTSAEIGESGAFASHLEQCFRVPLYRAGGKQARQALTLDKGVCELKLKIPARGQAGNCAWNLKATDAGS